MTRAAITNTTCHCAVSPASPTRCSTSTASILARGFTNGDIPRLPSLDAGLPRQARPRTTSTVAALESPACVDQMGERDSDEILSEYNEKIWHLLPDAQKVAALD